MYKAGKEIDLEYIQMLYHCKKYNELFEIIKEPVKVKDDEKYADYDYIHYFILSLIKTKNYKKALEYSVYYTKKYPEDYRCFMDRAEVCTEIAGFKEKDWPKCKLWLERSLKNLKKAFDLNSNDVRVSKEIARIYGVLRIYDKAIEWFDRTIQQDSSVYQAYEMKADILEKLNDFDGANEVYKKYIERFPASAAYGYWKIGKNYQDNGDYKTAAQMFEQVLNTGDDFYYSSTLYNLVDCYRELGLEDKILETYAEALKNIDDEYKAEICNRAGNYLYEKNRYDEALSYYDMAINEPGELIPVAIEACNSVAGIMEYKKDYKKSLEYVLKGEKYIDFMEKKYADFKNDNPSLAGNIKIRRGSVEIQLEKFQDAIDSLKEALKYVEFCRQTVSDKEFLERVNECDTWINSNLVFCYLCLRDNNNAEIYLENIKVNKADPWYYFSLAELSYRKGDKKSAKEYFKKYVDLNGSDNFEPDEQDYRYFDLVKDKEFLSDAGADNN